MGIKKVDPLPVAIKQTSTDIKILNYELKRVVATQQDAFIILDPEYENQIDMIEGISTYGMLQVQNKEVTDDDGNIWSIGFPVLITLTNVKNEITDLEIDIS